MGNKFFSGVFGEKRFVFEESASKAPQGQASEAPKPPDAAEVEAKKEHVVTKTSEYLQDLKNTISKNFGDLVELVNFDGEVFEGTVDLGDFMKQKEDASKMILGKLEKKMGEKGLSVKDIDNLINFVWGLQGAAPLQVDSLKFIADVYTTSMLQAADASFKERYPLFDKLPNKGRYNVRYKISVANGGVSFLTEFEGDDVFKAEYGKLEKGEDDKGEGKKGGGENGDGKPEGEKKDSAQDTEKGLADKKAEEEQRLQKEANIKALKGSFLGGALAFLGIVKNDEWGDVVDGNNWLACFLVGMFGGGAMLTHDPFSDAIAGLDEKHKPLAEKVREEAQGSFFSLSKVKVGKISPEEAKKLREERSVYDGKKFSELIAGKIDRERKLPENGAKLGVDFEVKNDDKSATLVVDLKNGGEMVVPPKSSIVVDGETEPSGDSGKTYKGNEIKITGTIPKGTVFKGKVGFEVVTESA